MKSNGERHPEEILAHMEHTRAEMDDTLYAIERRLTPGQLVDQGMHYLRHSGGREFLSNFGSSVRDNPIPVALVGVGLAWLMMRGNAPRERPAEAGESLKDRASEMAASARDKASETAGSVRNKASETVRAVRGGYDAARARAGELGQSARAQLERAAAATIGWSTSSPWRSARSASPSGLSSRPRHLAPARKTSGWGRRATA